MIPTQKTLSGPSGRSASRQRLLLSASAAALVAGTFFIYGPMTIYAGNLQDLWFPLSAIGPIQVAAALGSFAVLTTLGYFTPGRAGRAITALVFGVGLALYIEGTFMPMDYGILDGKPIAWSDYSGRILFDKILWALCIALPTALSIWKKGLFKKLTPATCTAILVAQIAGVAGDLPRVRDHATSDYLTEEGKYTLGKEENIVVIVLDGCDNRMFERSIGRSKDLAGAFKDFTYYGNAMSASNYTVTAIPSILTGLICDNSVPFGEYIRSAYRRCPLLETLRQKGYDSRLFTFPNLVPLNDPNLAAFIGNKNRLDFRKKLALTHLLCRLSLLRQAPVFLKDDLWLSYDAFERGTQRKPDFFSRGKGINADLAFRDRLERCGLTVLGGKAFRFYHLQGAHDPVNLGRDLSPVETAADGDLARMDQAEGSLRIVAGFLREMKNAGVYENSTVIIAGDHGIISDPTIAYYLAPVLLIKNKHADFSSMKRSSAPVINSDIAATIMELIRPENDCGGSITEIEEDAKRTRPYYFLNLFATARKGYIPDMIEFLNESPTAQPRDFKKTGNIFSGKGVKRSTYKDYRLGKTIVSGDVAFQLNPKTGDKKIYGEQAVSGKWAWDSGDVFKTSGTSSRLGFTLLETPREIPVTMIAASAHGKNLRQRLLIEVNGTRLDDAFVFDGGGFEIIKFTIPGKLIGEDRALTLGLLTPDARRIGDPFEKLICFEEALHIRSLVMGKAGAVQQILFGSRKAGNSDFYKGAGWHDNEEKHTWSADRAELFLPLDPGRDAVLDFQLLFPPQGQALVSFRINGHDLGLWSPEIRGDTQGDYHKSIRLPREFLAGDGMNKLVFTMPAPPPLAAESRTLGLPIMRISVK